MKPARNVLRYGVALLAVAGAIALRFVLESCFGAGLPPCITFYPMVMAVAIVAGFGPGVLATVLAAITDMNILLVEDHPIFRYGVCQLLAGNWPQARISEAVTLAEALLAIHRNVYQFVIADLNLPDASGLEVVARLLRAQPQLQLLVLSLNSEVAYAQRALKIGAAGYLAKDSAASELVRALHFACTGRASR